MQAITSILILLCIAIGVANAALPDGHGKDATVKLCGTCHSPERATSMRLSKDGWEEELSKMIKMGAKGSEDDFNAVLDYVAKNFGPEAPRPVNVNTATSVDLESLLVLTRTESAALIQYRTDHGEFKSLDDLRKVPKLDFKKIEARKARIVF